MSEGCVDVESAVFGYEGLTSNIVLQRSAATRFALGNVSADLDSMMCSLVHAFVLTQVRMNGGREGGRERGEREREYKSQFVGR